MNLFIYLYELKESPYKYLRYIRAKDKINIRPIMPSSFHINKVLKFLDIFTFYFSCRTYVVHFANPIFKCK